MPNGHWQIGNGARFSGTLFRHTLLGSFKTPIALSLLLKKQEIDLLHFPVLGAWRVPYWDNSKQLPSWDVTKKCP
jgi:hypothetical protein